MSELVGPGVAVIVVSAGSGTRLGRDEPKAFVSLAGRPILAHALTGVLGMTEPAQIVVVAPESHLAEAEGIVNAEAGAAAGYVTVTPGGPSRHESVACGLALIADSVSIVLVHDAARALTPSSQFDRVVSAVRAGNDGVVPGLPVADTIKRIDGDGQILGTVDRSQLSAVQTPQGFPRSILVAAYAGGGEEATDDSGLVVDAGVVVHVVPGDPAAFKITTAWDLRRAEQLLAQRTPSTPRIRTGTGIDVHGFAPGRELWLAGLYWPGETGLAGHSDGDAVCHAITDALLSAAGLGDIGGIFGTADPELDGAHGEVFLRRTLNRLRDAGYTVGNVSVQVIGNSPRMGPRRLEAERHLSSLLEAPVSVSATTTDGLGFTGRGEGIGALATALIVSPGMAP